MRLKDQISFTMLQWVKPQLDEALLGAREALEAYVDQPGNATAMRSCVEHLRQIRGSLRMVELEGPAIVVEEMAALGDGLLGDAIRGRDDAYAVLMRGLMQLPDYLERVAAGHRDVPMALLPLLNDLRAARGEDALPPAALFFPDLGVPLPAGVPGADPADAPATALADLRLHFQQQLLGWFRGQDVPQRLRAMRRTLLAVAAHCSSVAGRRLWWIAAGALEGLEQGRLDGDAEELRRQASRVDRLLRALIEHGEDGVRGPDADEVARKFLYVVAHAREATPHMAALRATYALDALVPATDELVQARGSMAGYNRTLLDSVARALKEDLLRVKEALDLFLRQDAPDPAQLATYGDVLERVADTLGMLALPAARQTVVEQRGVLDALTNRLRPADEETLLEVAGALLGVESSLDDHIQRLGADGDASSAERQLSRADALALVAALMGEALVNTGKVRAAIVAFVESGWQHARLLGAPALLDEVAGALRMAEAPRAAELVRGIGRFLENELLADRRVPNGLQLDQLAEALAGAEYCLEAFRDHRGQVEPTLAMAEDRLRALGYLPVPPARESTQPPLLAVAAEPAEPAEPTADLSEAVSVAPGSDATSLLLPAPEAEDGAGAEPPAAAGGETLHLAETEATAPPQPLPAVDAAAGGDRTDGAGSGVPARDPLAADVRFNPAAEGIDDDIRGIFLEEMEEEIGNLGRAQAVWLEDPARLPPLADIRRAFHTLKGSGRLVGADVVGEFAWKLENMLNRVLDGSIQPDADVQAFVPHAIDALPGLLAALKGEGAAEAPLSAIMRVADLLAGGQSARLEDLLPAASAALPDDAHPEAPPGPPAAAPPPAPRLPAVDAVLLEILRSEVGQYMQTLRAAATAAGDELPVDEEALRAVHTLHGAIAMVEVPLLAQVLAPLESLFKSLHAAGLPLPADGVECLVQALQAVDEVMRQFGAPAPQLPDTAALAARLAELGDRYRHARAQQVADVPAADERTAPEAVAPDEAASDAAIAAPLAAADAGAATADAGATATATAGDADAATATAGGAPVPPAAAEPEVPAPAPSVDADLLDVFVEEAHELLDHADDALAAWRARPDEAEPVDGLRRDLHTLKGGARISGLPAIGDLAHAVETLLQKWTPDPKTAPALIGVLETAFDQLNQLLEQAEAGVGGSYPEALLARLAALANGDAAPAAEAPAAAGEAGIEPAVEPDAGGGVLDRADAPAVPPEAPRAAPRAANEAGALPDLLPEERAEGAAPSEQIRVRADLLDELVGYAGEVAIYRARLEQQVSGCRHNIGELEQTVARLRGQLRTLEIETEAQIIARFQRERRENDLAAFDPLEMDRYSQLQQYSRALAESVSDLSSLQATLDGLTRQAETLLVQQSRVGTELQEGLLHTRMLPFDTMVPNLRRTLRQAAREQGKSAQLVVDGARDEMDRSLLDRIKAPFEHMLRNAIAHGIESPAERRAAGKPAEGRVHIQVAREATEVVIRVADDGRGLDRAAIRRRGIERGLLAADAELTDAELLALITQTGFSTASKVSQLAGRGVGMDVVANEIRQLGGSLAIESEPGRGTTFVLRLPFTLSVTHAILVRTGDATFAIPMASVQTVARVAPERLAALLAAEVPTFHHGDEDFAVHDLAWLLDLPAVTAAGDGEAPALLLTRSGDVRAAVHVDAVLGSREIVVKPVGPQVSSVPGVLGATIMGDGSVLVILDLVPLVRHGVSRRREAAAGGARIAPRLPRAAVARPYVLVVDDSVTMRKVTSRVLERNGYDALTAIDGLDALDKLAERVPNLMLLDIEMPRMDGYELATQMKADPRWRHVPIIMITSRSGEKHRQRALDIGVERYLGKPYQEAELLAHVHEVLERDALEASHGNG